MNKTERNRKRKLEKRKNQTKVVIKQYHPIAKRNVWMPVWVDNKKLPKNTNEEN